MNAAQATLSADVAALIAYLPHLIAGIVIFGLGTLAAWLIGKAATSLAARLGLDRLGERRGVADDLQTIGLRTSLSRVFGRIVFLVIFVAALVQTVDALELAPLADALRQLLGYMPRVILAIVIVIFGAVIADAVAEAATVSARRAGILYDGVLGGLVRALILILAGLMALQQLTIDATFLLDVLVLVLGGVVAALAIAGGWGTRTIVENIVAGRYVSQAFAIGDTLETDGIAGVVERMDIANTSLRLPDGRLAIVPNSHFLSTTTRKTKAADAPSLDVS